MDRIYSYRIVHNSGFAPCTSNGLFSLACCKEVMRRVIGRQYITKQCSANNNPIWIVAVFSKYNSNKEENGQWLYCAKVTDVVTYKDYFTEKIFAEREDCIYKIINSKDFKNNNHSNIKWDHKGNNYEHKDKETQKKDWGKGRECYVLLSDEFHFFTHDEAIMLNEKFDHQIHKYIGHNHFDNVELITLFEKLVKKGTNLKSKTSALQGNKQKDVVKNENYFISKRV